LKCKRIAFNTQKIALSVWMMKIFLHENIKEHEVSPGQLDDPSACVFTGLGEPTPTPVPPPS
jgi:hypothetical protein